MQNKKIFTPEDFGAVADGVTDDSAAIYAAIEEASKCEGTVNFKKDSVYYLNTPMGKSPVKAALCLFETHGVTLKGENTTLRLGKIFHYYSVYGCTDITIDGFIFEMNFHSAFRGNLVNICHEKVMAVIKTDYEIPLENGYFDYTKWEFAMPDDQFRNHIWLRRIEKTDNENEYMVWFKTDHVTRMALRRVDYKQCDIIMPTPKLHANWGEGYYIGFSSNVHIQNCNIKEAPCFVGCVKGNSGDIYFDNVKMCAEKDQTIPMVGWRDGYHCKDNRGAIHWKNCEIGRLYDDAFNISCSNLLVVDQPEPDVLSLKNFENNGCYVTVKAGDVLSVYDVYCGTIYGEQLKVKEVIKQHGAELLIRLDKNIPEVDREHTKVMFETLCAPNSTIENCRVEGTVRIRCPITVKNTKFEKLLVMWTENEIVEGPVPRDMLFENCSFESVYPVSERYLDRHFSFRTVMVNPGVAEYKLKNIRLVDCKFDPKFLYIEEGNDVQIINTKA